MTQAERLSLFERGAEAFKAIGQGGLPLHGVPAYLCPICCVPFGREAAVGPNPSLTFEHAPPRSISPGRRPRPIALVCKSCNSLAGHAIDAEVAKRHALIRFHTGLPGKFKGKVTIDGRNLAATVQTGGQAVHVDIVPQANRREDVQAAQVAWSAGTRINPPGLTIGFPSYHERRAELSLLRSAYLASFALLGYTYCLSAGGALVRRQLNDLDGHHLSGFSGIDPEGDPARLAVCLATDEDDSWYPVVVMGIDIVILPGLGDDDAGYSRILAQYEGESTPIELGILGWPNEFELRIDRRGTYLPD